MIFLRPWQRAEPSKSHNSQHFFIHRRRIFVFYQINLSWFLPWRVFIFGLAAQANQTAQAQVQNWGERKYIFHKSSVGKLPHAIFSSARWCWCTCVDFAKNAEWNRKRFSCFRACATVLFMMGNHQHAHRLMFSLLCVFMGSCEGKFVSCVTSSMQREKLNRNSTQNLSKFQVNIF